jgi:hypothetical protein
MTFIIMISKLIYHSNTILLLSLTFALILISNILFVFAQYQNNYSIINNQTNDKRITNDMKKEIGNNVSLKSQTLNQSDSNCEDRIINSFIQQSQAVVSQQASAFNDPKSIKSCDTNMNFNQTR